MPKQEIFQGQYFSSHGASVCSKSLYFSSRWRESPSWNIQVKTNQDIKYKNFEQLQLITKDYNNNLSNAYQCYSSSRVTDNLTGIFVQLWAPQSALKDLKNLVVSVKPTIQPLNELMIILIITIGYHFIYQTVFSLKIHRPSALLHLTL